MNNRSLILGAMILEELQNSANSFRFSGNLHDSISLVVTSEDEVKIYIKAPKYNVAKYKRTGIIEYHVGKRAGSYAQAVNEYGKHKGWVQQAYKKAVQNFAAMNKGVIEHE